MCQVPTHFPLRTEEDDNYIPSFIYSPVGIHEWVSWNIQNNKKKWKVTAWVPYGIERRVIVTPLLINSGKGSIIEKKKFSVGLKKLAATPRKHNEMKMAGIPILTNQTTSLL